MTGGPRVIALALIVHPKRGDLFVSDLYDRIKCERFHRPPGGGVEFGETAAEALEREFLEEFGACVTVCERIHVVENLFEYDGRAGHEIMLVHRAHFDDPGVYALDLVPDIERGRGHGVWRPRSLTATECPLFPEVLLDAF
ncbi:NUDIX hydrolase [Luethyella okanaganae]|uniref:NUDIX hydrolase n=1 Tax=Luethyella okanaganae TaxID=69372 RepID=A0ABW1VG96_9MICO